MTSDDLWRVVGRELREARERQPGNLSILAHAADAAEIDVNTAKAIERGKPATISKLEDYAGSLGLSIVDVLSAVLQASEQHPTPEASALLRFFEYLDVENRRLVLWTAQRLFEQQSLLPAPAPAATPRPGGGRGPKMPPSK